MIKWMSRMTTKLSTKLPWHKRLRIHMFRVSGTVRKGSKTVIYRHHFLFRCSLLLSTNSAFYQLTLRLKGIDWNVKCEMWRKGSREDGSKTSWWLFSHHKSPGNQGLCHGKMVGGLRIDNWIEPPNRCHWQFLILSSLLPPWF